MTTQETTPRKTSPRPMFKRTCAECAAEFKGERTARFCSSAHRTAYHNRSMKRGKVAMPLMLAWRTGKNHTKNRGNVGQRDVAAWAFGQLCALADVWNDEDRAAGRMPSWQFVQPKMDANWRAVDLFA